MGQAFQPYIGRMNLNAQSAIKVLLFFVVVYGGGGGGGGGGEEELRLVRVVRSGVTGVTQSP